MASGLTQAEVANLRTLAAENAPLLKAWKDKVVANGRFDFGDDCPVASRADALSCSEFFEEFILKAERFPIAAGTLKKTISRSICGYDRSHGVGALRRGEQPMGGRRGTPVAILEQNRPPQGGTGAPSVRRDDGGPRWLLVPGGVLAVLVYFVVGGSANLAQVTPWVIFLVVVGVALALIGFTVWAAMDAFKRGKKGWGAAILLSWVFGLGWAAALVYSLAASRPPVSGATSGVAVNDGEATPSQPPAAGVMANIRKIAELHQAGILTNTEFAAKKADLLSRM